MKITILAHGTRGDIYPYLALALGLKENGHEVKLAAGVEFEADIQERGIQYAPIGASMREFLASEEGNASIFGEGKSQKQAKRKAKQKIVEHYIPSILNDLWVASQDADVLIYTAVLYHAWYIAEKLNIPAIISFPSPVMSPTGAFPMPEFPVNLGGFLNRLSFHTLRHLFFARDYKPVVQWCQETLKVTPGSRFTNYLYRNGQPIPVLYCYSPCLLPKPKDWGDNISASGYWFLDTTQNWQPPEGLEAFLAKGPPPVYVGFGSTVKGNPEETTQMIISALQQAGERGIISSGWGSMVNQNLLDSVYCVDYVPYEWLFPQVKAVVHHGGAGIVGTSLTYGKPTIACPFLPEQLFWGRLIHKRRVGPPPVPQKPQKNFTAERLAVAIKAATHDEAIRKNAEALGQCLRQENGIKNAVAFINYQIESWYKTSKTSN